MTVAMKIALGAAGAGLVGGIIAERVSSPDAINRSRDADRWNALHEDFLKEHPAPAGTRLFVNSEPAWKNAALAGGAGVGVAALGGGLLFAATKVPNLSGPLRIAGMGVAALGAAAALGTSLSWAVR